MKKLLVTLFLISNISHANWIQPLKVDPEIATPAFDEIQDSPKKIIHHAKVKSHEKDNHH